MKVLVVRPDQRTPAVEEIGESLESMQAVVGGYIEEYMPWRDDAAIICNEEGKIIGLPPCRIVTDDEGKLVDYIAGTFFVCYAPPESEDFLSLPEAYIEKYTRMFTV